MIEVLLVIFIITSGTLGYVLYRSLGRLSFYEDMYSDMYGHFFELGQEIRGLLDREIYSNEPVIIELVEQMKNIQHFVSRLSDNYRFNELAENKEDETA